MKKDLEWLKEQVKGEYEYNREKHNKEGFEGYAHREFVFKYVLGLLDQLDEPEVLTQEWINEHAKAVTYDGIPDQTEIVYVDDLQNLLVPKQEEVDQAYKDGYEIGKKHAFEKAGLEDKDKEPETVASVIADFYKSLERLKEVLGMEVEEIDNV